MADAVTVTKIIEVDVKASANASEHLKGIADSTKRIEEGAAQSGSALKQMVSWVKGMVIFQVFSAIGEHVMQFASTLQQASDASRQLEERMKLVTGSTEDASRAFDAIVNISIRQGRELDGTAKLYERLTRSSDAMAISQKGVALMTEGVAASLRLSGAGTQEANAAMLQFSQAISSGKLGGDEFRSLMENDSVLMQNLAKELHTTMGGLRQMSKDGKLDAGTLRDALFKMGDDGKNAMQRMIEQAARLPKTFDQAVTGAKTSLTDLINALQQTGDKAEGIFVRMVKKISESMREAATLIRDEAEIDAEIAKALGKRVTPKEEEEPFEMRRLNNLTKRREQTQTALERAEQAMSIGRNANRNNPLWESSQNYKLLAENVDRAKGALQGLQNVIEEITRRNAAGANPLAGLTTGKPEGLPPKVPKHPERTDKDVYKEINDQLKNDLDLSEARLQNISDYDIKVREFMQRMDKAKHVMTAAEREQAGRTLRGLVEQAELNKQEAEARKFMTAAVQKSDERVIGAERAKYDADKKRFLDEYLREHHAKDPFIGAEEEVAAMMKIAWDPRTTDEEAQKLFDHMHEIREKAAKQMMGEHDPLKNLGETMADSWSSGFDRMENDLLSFSKSAKDIVGDLVLSVLRDLAKIEMKETLNPLMEAGRSFIKTTVTDIFGSADGSAWGQGGMRMFGFGGVVNQPTAFGFNGGRSTGVMGEAGSEAVMPLARDRAGRLGVGTVPVSVIVNNYGSGTKTTQEQRTNANGEQEIVVSIHDVVEAGIGSGRFDGVMGKTFGLSRRGT